MQTGEVLSCPSQARVAGWPHAVLCSLPLDHGRPLELVPPADHVVLHESGPVGPFRNVMWGER